MMAGWKIHAQAHCTECSWYDGDQHQALDRARAHNHKTGHVVTAETGHAFIYDRPKLNVREKE